MRSTPKYLGTFVQYLPSIPDGRRDNVIELWPGYGVVCPSLLTSNGNSAMVARHLRAEMSLAGSPDLPALRVELTIGDTTVPTDADEQTILRALQGAISKK